MKAALLALSLFLPSVVPAGYGLIHVGCQKEIKGNISSERIYHLPGSRYYEQTVIDPEKGERWFCSEKDAERAGWRKAR